MIVRVWARESSSSSHVEGVLQFLADGPSTGLGRDPTDAVVVSEDLREGPVGDGIDSLLGELLLELRVPVVLHIIVRSPR